jgi:hypothetical protein
MSHVVCSSVVITDLYILKKALAKFPKLKWEDKKTYSWYGQWANDYDRQDAAYKNGIDVDDYGKCDACLQMDGIGYEIGIVRRRDGEGWSIVWDHYRDGKRLSEYIGRNAEHLMAAYSEEYTRQFAERNGFILEEQIDGEGNLVLTMFEN